MDLRHLRAVSDTTGRRLDVVGATLDADAGWAEAMAGVADVIHVASPAPKSVPRAPDDVIGPAVGGTRRVLQAAARAGVRRVVLTSSIAAVCGGHDMRDGRVRTEEDWSIVERCDPYQASKALAEQEAWRIAGVSSIELVSICPGLVLGPMQRPGTNASMDVVDQLLRRAVPALPHIGFSVVDARDVAAAHRLAVDGHSVAGRRFIVAGEPSWLRDIARILADEYGPRGARVPLAELPSPLVRIGALVNRSFRLALPLLDQPVLVSSRRARDELGWARSRTLRATLIDAADSLAVVAKP